MLSISRHYQQQLTTNDAVLKVPTHNHLLWCCPRHQVQTTAHLGALRLVVSGAYLSPCRQHALAPRWVSIYLSVSEKAVRAAAVPGVPSAARVTQRQQRRHVDASRCIQLARCAPPHLAHPDQAEDQGGSSSRVGPHTKICVPS
jgi:hypothetical protein